MGSITVARSKLIDAPPERVYAFLVDFRTSHPKILPPQNFIDYRVEEGGKGDGTLIAFRFRAGRRERGYRMRIEADESARRIVERDENSTLRTTWALGAAQDGAKTQVDLTSIWQGAAGIGGFFERTFAPPVLRRIYDRELSLLATAVT